MRYDKGNTPDPAMTDVWNRHWYRIAISHGPLKRSESLLPLLDRFEEEGIDFQVFLALTQDDMRELGLKMGDRKRVVMAQEYFVK